MNGEIQEANVMVVVVRNFEHGAPESDCRSLPVNIVELEALVQNQLYHAAEQILLVHHDHSL